MVGVPGHFTQRDPIGLAGGINQYGYAGGDPVNYSDPFGLRPCQGSSAWTECLAQAAADWGAKRGGAVGAAVLNFAAAANAAMEAAGVNGAASAGDAIGSGDVLGGVASAAITVGTVGRGGSVRGLIADATNNPSGWKTVAEFAEKAVSRRARGGTSIQTVLENEAGDQLVRHTLVDKTGKVVEEHLRPMLKP